jgi:Na+-driven multidrug efflux pump
MRKNCIYRPAQDFIESKFATPTCFNKADLLRCRSISWKNIWEYLKLGVPSMASILFENIAFEGIALLIGLLGDETILAAHSICYNVLTFSFIIPVSFNSNLIHEAWILKTFPF